MIDATPPPCRSNSIKIYVESEMDADLYGLLYGHATEPKIEFIAPSSGDKKVKEDDKLGGGYRAVCKALLESRGSGQHNGPVYGLLDGEESVRYGDGRKLFRQPNLVFTVDDPMAEGLLFLGCYEKENIYLRYGDAIRTMENRQFQGLRPKKTREDRMDVSTSLDTSMRMSLLKCAAKIILYNRNVGAPDQLERPNSDHVLGRICTGVFDKRSISEVTEYAFNFWQTEAVRKLFSEEFGVLAQACGFDLSVSLKHGFGNRHLLALCDGAAMLRLGFDRDRNYIIEDFAAILIENGFGIDFRRALMAAMHSSTQHASSRCIREVEGRQPLMFRHLESTLALSGVLHRAPDGEH